MKKQTDQKAETEKKTLLGKLREIIGSGPEADKEPEQTEAETDEETEPETDSKPEGETETDSKPEGETDSKPEGETETERLRRELAEARAEAAQQREEAERIRSEVKALIDTARTEGEIAGRNARIDELIVSCPSDSLPPAGTSAAPRTTLDSIFSLAAGAR